MFHAHTVDAVIKYLLPRGSRASPNERSGDGALSWDVCPEWPADVFAVVATIVEQSDCYTCIGRTIYDLTGLNEQHRLNKEAREFGKEWADTLGVPPGVQLLWKQLLNFGGDILDHRNSSSDGSASNPPRLLEWERIALRLLAISDEAGRGLGWAYPVAPQSGQSLGDDDPQRGAIGHRDWIAARYSTTAARFLLEEFKDRVATKKTSYLMHLPHSICCLVPRQLACVQPKSNTPQMGCTIRALSHHLALLPGIGVAESEWVVRLSNPPGPSEDDPGALNILVVPFPYDVRGSDFHITQAAGNGHDGLFAVRQGWLRDSDRKRVTALQLKDFVVKLIDAASSEVRRIDVVVFPELALSNSIANGLATLLAEHYSAPKNKKKYKNRPIVGPDLLICGTSGDSGGENLAMTFVIDRRQAYALPQSKHHRWRIDGHQIKSYHLGHAFNPKRRYWEKIPLRERHLRFVVNRNHEVIAALVCEDLARNDPVMPLLNAVGPNLVVALLMDGPQLISRWPGRYATVLADDPGSAVLSVTSLGMVRRSRAPDKPMPGNDGRRCVAIWREPDQGAQELDLPQGAHALVLALTSHPVQQTTLDLRDDANMAFRLELSAVRAIAVDQPPKWLDRSSQMHA